jgi:hypothetical protein
MAWAVLLFWNTKGFSRAIRIFMFVFLLLTMVAAIGVGEHYFVDLVAGLPFALFVQAVVWPGEKPAFSQRAITAATGLGLTLAWMLLVRFGAQWMLISPILPWALIVATTTTVWIFRVRSSASPKSSPQTNDTAPPQSLAFGAHG